MGDGAPAENYALPIYRNNMVVQTLIIEIRKQ